MPETNPEPSAAGSGGARALPLASSLPAGTQALPVLSAGQAEGLCPLPWKEVSVQSDGRHVVVLVTASAQSIRGVQISEAEDQVDLKVYGASPRATYSAGPLTHTLALIELPTALGGRRLVAPPLGDCTD